MITYKLCRVGNAEPHAVITAEGRVIPFDPANTDYVAYLKWLEEGNVPEPAEE
jgi:hypothetical protein